MSPARENPVPAFCGLKNLQGRQESRTKFRKIFTNPDRRTFYVSGTGLLLGVKKQDQKPFCSGMRLCAQPRRPSNNRDFSPCRQIFFKPDKKRADPSFREYFMRMGAGVKKHLTEPYISAASGIFCRMVSGLFQNLQGFNFILCFFFRN